ncbi:MAG: hypothetical protein CMP59_01615 [Flavobacteriales bacterium]|nr:hypothetical protein [Flavobacteriales bacterium]
MRLFYLILGLIASSLLRSQTSFDEKVTTASNVRLAVTNVGTFGNAFRGYRDGTSNESCEYPAGSGIEHLFESGIWIGGLQDGTQVRVSTAAVDAPQGYQTGNSGFEFTAAPGAQLTERSSLRDSPFFTPEAISQQDFVCTFTDRNLIIPGTSTPIVNHTNPLFVQVNLKTYNFNFSFSDFVVFVDMEIINLGNQGSANVIDSLFFGLWGNTVVRNINVTPPGSGGAAFYNKGGNGYDTSLHMAYCYDYSGDVGFTNTYVAQKFLGAEDKFGFHHPRLDSTFNSNYNVWQFNNPGTGVFQAPAGENQRYQKLSRGVEDDPCWTIDNNCGGGTFPDQLNREGNRSDLVSIGPFRDFRSGDTIKVAYAFVLANKLEDGNSYTANTEAQRAELISNAQRAQTAYNGEDANFNGVLDEGEDKDNNGVITRFILPAPPEIPKTRVEAEEGKINVYWTDNSERSVDPISRIEDFEGYRIYLSKLGFDVVGVPNLLEDLVQVGEYDIANNGFANEVGLDAIQLEDPVTFEGDTNVYRYRYTIDKVLNGWQYAIAVSAFDRGNDEQNLDPLESSLLGNNFRVFPGKAVNDDIEKSAPYAYPNPYYFGASWEGRSNFQEQSRKLIFANLPERCYIRIFTPAGDLIDEIYHDQDYKGEDIRWYQTFGAENSEENVFSGGEHAWDLLSSATQIISRGVYVFAVEDLETGEVRKGKFTILK